MEAISGDSTGWGHISFFGLGAVNFMFALTAQPFMTGVWLRIASLAFLIGAGSMPLACLAFAHNNRLHLLFSIPVSALLVGAVLTFVQLFRL